MTASAPPPRWRVVEAFCNDVCVIFGSLCFFPRGARISFLTGFSESGGDFFPASTQLYKLLANKLAVTSHSVARPPISIATGRCSITQDHPIGHSLLCRRFVVYY